MSELNLTKAYELQLLDLQDPVESVDPDFTLYDLFVVIHKFEQSFPGMAAIFGFPTFDAFWELTFFGYSVIEIDEKREELFGLSEEAKEFFENKNHID